MMPPERQQKILIVEDDLDLAEMLNAYFSVQGYHVTTAGTGSKAIEEATNTSPDIVLLDIRLPDIDGFEVCRRLQESHKTRAIPILFLTERSQREDRLHGLGMGVVDYITKPFDIQELRLRVRNALHRAAAPLTENPVTGLPEGEPVNEALLLLLSAAQEWAALVAALRGLGAFREMYGFIASDDVLRVISLMLDNATREIGGEQAICGHLDQETFVMIVPASRLEALQSHIQERAAQSLEYFYPRDNRGAEAHTTDRLRLPLYPLTVQQGTFESLEQFKQHIFALLKQAGL